MVISGFNLKVVAVQLSERDEMAGSNGTVNGTQNGTVPKRVRIKERRLRALELRMRGLTYADIASQVGYASPSGAHKAVRAALEAEALMAASEVRDLLVMRLETLLQGIWDAACRGDLQAIDRVLRVLDREAKLLGLDLPPQPENPPEELPVKAYINFPMDDI